MPEMHGIDAIERICANAAQAKIVILTTYQGEDSVPGPCAPARAATC